MTTLLEIDGLVGGWGHGDVLRGVALDVAPGEIVTVIGANGAGKTTLLRTICGLNPPRAGAIRFAGRDIGGRPAERIVAAGIVMVPEGRRVFQPMSVRENLVVGAYLRLRAGERRAVAADLEGILELFPRLAERHDQLAGTLSGGEQQMLAIGRALMGRPKLLLLDEPSMGLAPLVVSDIFATITALNRRDGMSIIVAEQNARMALRVAHRGYVLDGGHIAAAASSAELRRDASIQRAYFGV
jgi:branched-chain amino acid transport system ATP-binding protein